jgi:RNA polymerase sigma-70 factor (family 1)
MPIVMPVYNKYTDEKLLELLRQNSNPAFNEIYSRYWQKLFSVAYNRLKDTPSAEDIVHDVFTSLWANRHKSEITHLENYLAVAAKYAVLGKIKRNERWREFEKSREWETGLAPVSAIETSLHYKRILELLQTEVEKLPEKCRLIFKSSRNEGKPVKQIARELQISPKTVETQLARALKHLKIAIRTFLLFWVLFFFS